MRPSLDISVEIIEFILFYFQEKHDKAECLGGWPQSHFQLLFY